MLKQKVKFTEEGNYALHPAFGPIITVKVGDEDVFEKEIADQIVADEWGKIISEVSDDTDFNKNPDATDEGNDIDDDDDEAKWPTLILDRFLTEEIDEEHAKKLLTEKALNELNVVVNQLKSVSNIVSELLIEIEMQEDDDD